MTAGKIGDWQWGVNGNQKSFWLAPGWRKSRQLLGDFNEETLLILEHASRRARILTRASIARQTSNQNSISLVVTSPPSLDVVQYADDNWLTCWFLGIGVKEEAGSVGKRQ